MAGVVGVQAFSRSFENRPSRQRDVLFRVTIITALAVSILLPLLD